MHITVQWDDESHTILRYTYTSRWTWADYESAVAKARELLNAEAQPNRLVDVIADFSHSSVLPDHAIANFRRSLQTENAIAFGITVLITGNQFIRTMVEVFGRLNQRTSAKLRTANNLDEARSLIAGFRASAKPEVTVPVEIHSV
jgi:hypothetical protein